MKKEKIQEWLQKFAEEGKVDIEKVDFDEITTEINQFYNDGVKAEKEKTKNATVSEFLSELGFSQKEELTKALDKTDKNEELEKVRKELEARNKEFETVVSELNETKGTIEQQNQMKSLKGLGFKDDRLERAMKLIKTEMGEDDKFEDVAKKLAEDTPEWLDTTRQVDFGGNDTGGNDPKKDEDAKALEEAWR